ncbi:hypothetical protein GJ697_13195 [Pseudoduganella sp. FT25W]|uniref:Uncharacterized protein n=1 Tax=Duganella alba TaxID=2666081 RepID=A0A6L5QG86_9BURK|nr:hypothetical protein [Duganella alba]MRX08794.1 hypothetical protein [Duganella alba]MRX18718.1 hypothetical protein [Duganella alba]
MMLLAFSRSSFSAILCLLLAVSGCATENSMSEVLILISKSGADFYGKTYTSRTDLATALVSKQVSTVHLVLDHGVPYNQVEMTFGAVQDAVLCLMLD